MPRITIPGCPAVNLLGEFQPEIRPGVGAARQVEGFVLEESRMRHAQDLREGFHGQFCHRFERHRIRIIQEEIG